MFKKQIVLIGMLLVSLAASADKNPFYYDLISNDSKSINFIFGVYPNTYNYVEGKDVDGYTSIKCAVINNAKTDFKWVDYKIMVMLKTGKLIRSYTTVAKDGDYNCNYYVDAGVTRYQYFCFHTKFTNEDIDKVWLILSDDQVFNLTYDKNE